MDSLGGAVWRWRGCGGGGGGEEGGGGGELLRAGRGGRRLRGLLLQRQVPTVQTVTVEILQVPLMDRV